VVGSSRNSTAGEATRLAATSSRRLTVELTLAVDGELPGQLACLHRSRDLPVGAATVASHALIDAHLAALRHRRLPSAAVDEMADGLIETYDQRVRDGLDQDSAGESVL
jgi:hypothetical protein